MQLIFLNLNILIIQWNYSTKVKNYKLVSLNPVFNKVEPNEK